MTHQEITPLTPEEQAQAPAGLLAAIENGSVVARAWLASWRSQRSIGEEATAQAEEIKQEIATAIKTAPQEQASLAQWCGFPTDMTRCSPFFPMQRNELGKREFLRDFIITSSNWGEILYNGPKLSTYEEDSLMALLALLDGTSKNKHISEVEGRKTYTYKGPALPLLRILDYKRPGKEAYKRLISSLELLVYSGLKLLISSGKTKTGKRRSPKIIYITTILSSVIWDDEKKELSVTVNPFFYETYMAGSITLIDVAKRMSLKGAISKSLYRFVQSQRANPIFAGHFLTLADALNIDREQPAYKIRDSLKRAINELIRQGVLMKKSGFVDQDIIKLNRESEALPNTRAKKSENR